MSITIILAIVIINTTVMMAINIIIVIRILIFLANNYSWKRLKGFCNIPALGFFY